MKGKYTEHHFPTSFPQIVTETRKGKHVWRLRHGAWTLRHQAGEGDVRIWIVKEEIRIIHFIQQRTDRYLVQTDKSGENLGTLLHTIVLEGNYER